MGDLKVIEPPTWWLPAEDLHARGNSNDHGGGNKVALHVQAHAVCVHVVGQHDEPTKPMATMA